MITSQLDSGISLSQCLRDGFVCHTAAPWIYDGDKSLDVLK